MGAILRKDELEVQLKQEHQLIQDGIIRDESPLDFSAPFQRLCDACRIGDLKACHEAIAAGANINARDTFDYTPLILASLCGHYYVVRFLLESGALCERDTFQGERCIYNALTTKIRDLLLEYDYSKSTDPLQPFASHISSLLSLQNPKTSDITLTASNEQWNLHKLILSARSPYFSRKLAAAPETVSWKLANTIPSEAFEVAVRYLYMEDIPKDLGLTSQSKVTEEEVFIGISKISKQLELESLVEGILAGRDRRLARQRHQDETTRGREQIEQWYRSNVLEHKVEVDTSKAAAVKWDRNNRIFADVLLKADEYILESPSEHESPPIISTPATLNGIPIGSSATSRTPSVVRNPRKSILFPTHKAILLRSDYFKTMFSSAFKEAQESEYLRIVNVDCTPQVLEIVLDYLYTETVHIPIEHATDILFASDMLFIEPLKNKAATVISTVGMGGKNLADRTHLLVGEEPEIEVESINVYDVIRAAWHLNIQKLEEFCARYIAYRLEFYIEEEEFEELILESASRIEKRQETDSIELLDDIRFYLDDRFRLRMQDLGLEDEVNIEDEMKEESEVKKESQVKEESEAFNEQSTDRLHLYKSMEIRALNGEIAADEFAADAINYQVLIDKIDLLLEKLKLDA